MLRRLTLVLLSAAVLLSLPAVQANAGAGDAVHFLRSGIGPRARAMGGAFTAACEGVSSLFWNPAALLGEEEGVRFGGGYESRFAGLITFNHIGGALISETLGGGALWMFLEPYSVYQLSGGLRVSPSFALGASSKLYVFGEGTQRGTGLGLDISMRYRWSFDGGALMVGANSRDIGWTRVAWDAPGKPDTDHAAWVSRLGAAVSFDPDFGIWTLATDAEIALRRPPRPDEEDYLARVLQMNVSVGGEVWIGPLALRAGMEKLYSEEGFGAQTRPTLGIGVVWEDFVFDAAYVATSPAYTWLLAMEFGFAGL